MKKIISIKHGLSLIACGLALVAPSAMAQTITSFSSGDIVVSTVSDQINPGTANGADLDTASPIALQEFTLGSGGTSVGFVGSFTLTQTSSGSNSAISGEYGSASEGTLQLSADGQSLTIIGYGVNASAFNSAPVSTYGNAALGQSTSLTTANQTGTTYTTVPRVVALIGANGSVDTSTALTGIYNTNNPRSVATVDGSSFYVSGQSVTGDGLGGVYYAPRGATTATAIDNSTETRTVSIFNNTLYVSRDAKGSGGSGNNTTNVSSLTASGGGLPTSSTGVTTTHLAPGSASVNGGNTASIDLPAAANNPLDNGVNNARNGKFVYLSPEQYFFASPTVMYVTDSGQPKNGNANAAALGEGGLQKWVFSAGAWTLQYDLYAGLNLVNNANANSLTPTAPGVTGLFGLTGEVVGGNVELFATSYGLNELSTSYLYEITDTLSATTAGSESFTTLQTAPTGTLFRGVSFAPSAAPEPSTWAMLIGGLALLFLGVKRSRKA